MRKEEGGRGKEELLEFLKSKRWFGDKTRAITEARVRDTIPVDWPGSKSSFAVSRVDVTTDAGTSTYQLFSPRSETGEPTLTVDALETEDFQRGLADAWATGAEFAHAKTRWVVRSEGKTPLVVPPNALIETMPGEQTNSSLALNREAILKLYRKLERGIHPDIEVTRFLTHERKFVHVPVLLGTIQFEDEDGSSVAGMLQEYVRGATDGWTYALERFNGGYSLTEEAERLGQVVRAMHENLASGRRGSDFDIRPAGFQEELEWLNAARETIVRGFAALRAARRDKALVPVATAVNAILDRAADLLPPTHSEEAMWSDAGGSTRIHGDLHLGQVLRSAAGQFLIIDFEGEPTRPLRLRRARSSPLRDVAGMLRSFSYVPLSALGAGRKVDLPAAETWEQDARAAFQRGYFEAEESGDSLLLPRPRENADRLIRWFELEKAFYELQYELDHRPDWAWIPVRGIARLLA